MTVRVFFSVPQRKQGQKSGLQNQKRKENESRALSFSRLRRQLPLGGSLCSCAFFLCAAEKANAEFKFSKLKVCTFFFCGSAVRRHEPFWEEGVTRERDGRSPRDGKAAHFSFFAPQSDTE